MKTLRKISKSPFFALLLIFSFMNVSLGGNIHLNKSLESIEKAKTNNDEMIRSIIFADGVITSDLPVLNDYVPNLSKEKSLELKNFEKAFTLYKKGYDLLDDSVINKEIFLNDIIRIKSKINN